MNQLPQKFLEKLPEFISEDNLVTVLGSFNFKKPPTFRTNTIKITTPELLQKLKEEDIEVETVPWNKDTFILINVPQKVLTATSLYSGGFFYIQSLSSMIPPIVLDPKPNEKILDITAAPGSKTTQMAALMDNTGEIVANDKSRVRLYKLEANLKIQGVANTTIVYMDATKIWKKFPEYFDKTLVDVPCSMEGRFFIQDKKTYWDWTTNKIKYLQSVQKFILRSAISSTKVGGVVVYSTCTLSPEENEEVVEWVLEKEAGKVILEEIHIPNLGMVDGLDKYKGKSWTSELTKTKRILPSKLMEGFFIAKLKKVSSTLS